MIRWTWLAVLAVVAALVAACQAGQPSTATNPTADATHGLSATLDRYREDDSTHVVQLKVRNGSGQQIALSALALHWKGRAELPPSTESYLMAPGQVNDLPVAEGDAVCSSPPRLDEPRNPAPVSATAMVSFDGADAVTVRFPVEDPADVLPRVYVPLCRAAAVAYAADIAFANDWRDDTVAGKPAVRVTLQAVRQHSRARVRVEGLRGSVLLRVNVEEQEPQQRDPPLLLLDPSETHAEVAVVFTQSGDCRPHALAESKHTFFLPAEVTIGDAAPVSIFVFPDDAAKARLNAMINRSCGVG